MYLVACAISPILILIVVSLYWRFSHAGRLMARIPSITGRRVWPVIGNVLDMLVNREQMFELLRESFRQNGSSVTKISGVGYRYLNIYDPDDIEIVMTKFNEKQTPYTFLKPWLGDGLLVSNGDKWMVRRKALTPAFHFNILRQFATTFSEHTELLLRRLEGEAGSPRTDLVPLVSRATLNIMCETSMGTSMHEGLQSVSQRYFEALQYLGWTVLYRFTRAFLHAHWTFRHTSVARAQRTALKDLHAFTDKIIMERRVYRQSEEHRARLEGARAAGRGGRLAMLDLLLESERIDALGVREEVDTFMFEGHDTTAMALCFMMMRLANEPKVQEAIVSELQTIFAGSARPPSVEDLSRMRYLECCIKESLRLYPSVPYIARYLHEDAQLGGYCVPAGTVINIHVFDVHRLPDHFPEPDRFLPERFLPSAAAARHPFAYVPFSAGPRNCIGQRFAMLELKTVMSGVLRRFRLEPVTRPDQLRFCADLTLRTSHPLYVRFTVRR